MPIASDLKVSHYVLHLSAASVDDARLLVDRLRADPRFLFVSHAYISIAGRDTLWPVDRIDVQFKENVLPRSIDSLLAATGAIVLRRPYPDSAHFAYRLQFPAGADPLAFSRLMDRHPLVAWAGGDAISNRRPQYIPTDPLFVNQFHLKNSRLKNGVPVDINAAPAWDLTIGTSVKVAVIDDGIDGQHCAVGKDLYLTPCAGMSSWDAFSVPGEGGSTPCCNDTHGTAVAGLIAASHNNGVGGVGVAPGVTLRAIRIFRRTYPPESFQGTQTATDAQIADAINWAWNSAFSDVISNSWGGGVPSNAITSAISNALSAGRGGKGTAVVFAAGNTSQRSSGMCSSTEYPANLTSTLPVIAVGAIDASGDATDYTPCVGQIDVVAPSGQFTGACVGAVVTTDRVGAAGCNSGPNGEQDYTATFSGTSAAAPQVAGIAALLIAREPSITAEQVRFRLRSGSDAWGTETFQGSVYNTFGWGKANAYKTLTASATIGGRTQVRPNSTCTWTVTTTLTNPPYTYQWFINETPVPGGTSSSYTYTAGNSSFTISATVTNAIGATVRRDNPVTVTSSTYPC